jgi:alpha-N-arabinofuranosidase
MFANHLGTEILGADLQGAGEKLFYSATRDKGTVYLKLVNASSTPQQVKISLAGVASVKPTARVVSLSAPSTATTNSISDPKRVVPVESTVKGVGKEFTRTLPGYSIEVLDIGAE